jgi:hypothetical protein
MKIERVHLLEKIGFDFHLRKGKKDSDHEGSEWENMYEALCNFKKSHGHCNVPARFSDNQQLANWVQNMRKGYKYKENNVQGRGKKQLSDTRIDRLNSIGFQWFVK